MNINIHNKKWFSNFLHQIIVITKKKNKKILKSLVFLWVLWCVFYCFFSFPELSFAKEKDCWKPPDYGTYEWYNFMVECFCEYEPDTGFNHFWVDWKTESFIKKTDLRYQEIPKFKDSKQERKQKEKEIKQAYINYLREIKEDKTADEVATKKGPFRFIEMGVLTHKGTMNAIYRCGVLKARLNGIQMIEDASKEIPDTHEVRKRVQEDKQNIQKLLKKYECTSDVEREEDSYTVKKKLLDQSAYQMCNFEYYLFYIEANIKNDIRRFYDESTEWFFEDSEKITFFYRDALALVIGEQERVLKAFNLAFVALAEFEKNYPLHIALLFIYEDLKNLRRWFRSVLAPVQQAIFKTVNAQRKM